MCNAVSNAKSYQKLVGQVGIWLFQKSMHARALHGLQSIAVSVYFSNQFDSLNIKWKLPITPKIAESRGYKRQR